MKGLSGMSIGKCPTCTAIHSATRAPPGHCTGFARGQRAIGVEVVVHAPLAERVVEVVRRQAAHGVPSCDPGLVCGQVVLRVVRGDLAPGGEPHLVVAGDVAQHLVERGDAVRLADQEGVQRHAHHRAGLRAFLVQLVELRLADLGEARGGVLRMTSSGTSFISSE